MSTEPIPSTVSPQASSGRRLRTSLFAVIATVALLGAACSSDDDSSSSSDDSATDGTQVALGDDNGLSNCGDVAQGDSAAVNQGGAVSLVDFEFCQQEIMIEVGEAVTWSNFGSARHTATDDSGNPDRLFVSEPILPGEEFVWSFDEPGTYDYICTFHPDLMMGTITVQ